MVAPRPGSDVPHTNPPRPAPAPGPQDAAADAQAVASTPAPAPAVVKVAEALPLSFFRVLPEEPAATEEAEAVEFDYCTWRNGNVQVWGAQAMDDGSFILTQEQLEEIANGGPRP
jgi:hypothetical protein